MAFIDDFTDTNGTILESHTPSGGTAWTLAAGNAGACEIENNLLRCKDKLVFHAYVCDDQGSADHYSEATAIAFGNAFRGAFVCIRLVDEDNWIGWKIHGTGSAGLRIASNVAATIDDTHFQGQGAGVGTVTRIEGDGTTIKLYEDSSEVASVTISDHQTETSQGVSHKEDRAFDWVDDFEAAALAAPAALIERPLVHSFAVQRAANY